MFYFLAAKNDLKKNIELNHDFYDKMMAYYKKEITKEQLDYDSFIISEK